MSSSRVLARSARAALGAADVCGVCQARQSLLSFSRSNALLPSAQGAVPPASRRHFAQQRVVKRLRADVDRKSRTGYYQLSRREKILLLEPDVAEAIYSEFVNRKGSDPSSSVKALLTRYNTDLNSISGLAILTFQVPDLSDPRKRAMLPPSPHKANAAQLLIGCAELGDPLAVKQIVTADYLALFTKNPPAVARELASYCTRLQIGQFRGRLNGLKLEDGLTDDPEALTLIGLIAEADNHLKAARGFYEQALQVPWVYDYSVRARHPAQLPITPPWIALGALLGEHSRADVRALARPVLEKGAKQGDDPLACYMYAVLLDQVAERKEWVRFMTKAAASGHRAAMLELARFYRKTSTEGGKKVREDKGGNEIGLVMGWRRDSAKKLAREWYTAAGKAGQLDAWEELAAWFEEEDGEGDWKAKELQERIVGWGESVEGEFEFGDVVKRARERLIRGRQGRGLSGGGDQMNMGQKIF